MDWVTPHTPARTLFLPIPSHTHRDSNPGRYLPKLDPKPAQGGKKLRRSSSDAATKGSVFGVSQRQMPSHFTIAPDWSSEAKQY